MFLSQVTYYLNSPLTEIHYFDVLHSPLPLRPSDPPHGVLWRGEWPT